MPYHHEAHDSFKSSCVSELLLQSQSTDARRWVNNCFVRALPWACTTDVRPKRSTTRVDMYSVCVGRNLWICDIHGSACAIYGFILCAEIHGLRRYLWIAQGSCLRGPREIFAGPPAILSHTCLLCNFSCNISGQFALCLVNYSPRISPVRSGSA